MNLQRIRELTLEIEKLEKELKREKELVLENFRNMSEEDIALCENRISDKGINIVYFPVSTSKSVDSAKLKEDGIYDKYLKVSTKSDYIKVTTTEI